MSGKSLVKTYCIYKGSFNSVKGIISLGIISIQGDPQFLTQEEAEDWIINNCNEWESLVILPLYQVKKITQNGEEEQLGEL